MAANRGRLLAAFLVVAGMGMACQAHAKSHKKQNAGSDAKIYPQLVHISYVEGDVRMSRGDEDKKVSKSDWGVAVAGLPVQTGYYIATGGDGRAEIEFEDASTVYLAPNSVLAFNDIHSKGDVPFTSLALLTGTLTMHVDDSGGSFKVLMPTGGVTAAKEKPTYLSISSYLDGFAITPLADGMLQMPNADRILSWVRKGETVYYKTKKQDTLPSEHAAKPSAEMAAWDQWVDQRVTERATEMAAVMKESGIEQPLPGLAAFYGKGTFFKCGSYGTCWVPSKKKAETEEPVAMNASRYGGPADPMLGGDGQYSMGWANSPEMLGFGFPCDPYWMFDASVDPNWALYDWGLCSYGSWLPYDGGYAWVTPTMSGTQGGTGRHIRYRVHRYPPVRWVHYGHKTGFVPLNPRDVKGRPPLNLRHGVFLMHGRQVEHMPFNGRDPVRALRAEPAHYLRPVSMRLAQAHAPRPVARSLTPAARSVAVGHGPQNSHLVYDRSTQSFLLSRPVDSHGRISTHVESFVGTQGRLQARAMGIDGRGTYHTEMSYGGFRIGRIGPGGGVMRGGSYGWANPGMSAPSYGGFGGGGGGFGGGSMGGGMGGASGGPAPAAGGARN
ncbi:MAG: FecR domain-containing protein [Acidobacteriota bacterium]